MKPGIRHLENHLRKQAWEGSGGLHSLSSLSGKQFQPSQHTHYTSSQTQESNRRVETQPFDDKKEGRHKEELGEQDKWNEADKDQKAGDRYRGARQQKQQTGIDKVLWSTAGSSSNQRANLAAWTVSTGMQ